MVTLHKALSWYFLEETLEHIKTSHWLSNVIHVKNKVALSTVHMSQYRLFRRQKEITDSVMSFHGAFFV